MEVNIYIRIVQASLMHYWEMWLFTAVSVTDSVGDMHVDPFSPPRPLPHARDNKAFFNKYNEK